METRSKLRQLGITPRKQRGQNFTVDPTLINLIVEFGQPQRAKKILEIGSGLGALSGALSFHSDLTLIEIEPKFCLELERLFPQAKVICADILSLDLAGFGADLAVFGNLPYSISSDIIFKLIEGAACIERAVLLLQREFVERLGANPGGREYGALSIACQLWADVRIGPIIRPESFYPRPEVDSALVELTFLKTSRVGLSDAKWFRQVVRAAFSKRRKMLSNSLLGLAGISKDQVCRALKACEIDPKRRAETLSIEEFAGLAARLREA